MADKSPRRRLRFHRLLAAWLVTASLSLNALAIAPPAVGVAGAPAAICHCPPDDPAGCTDPAGCEGSCLSACVAGSPALTVAPSSFDEIPASPKLPAFSSSERTPFHPVPPLRPPISR